MKAKQKKKKTIHRRQKKQSKRTRQTIKRRPTKGVRRVRPNLRRPKRKSIRRVLRKKESVKQMKLIPTVQKKVKSMEQTTEMSTGVEKEEKIKLIEPKQLPVRNVLNVGQYVRKNTKFKVSTDFVRELIGRLENAIDTDLRQSEVFALGEGRKTLMEEHLIKAYNFRSPEKQRLLVCTQCGNGFILDTNEVDLERIYWCPHCGQKKKFAIE